MGEKGMCGYKIVCCFMIFVLFMCISMVMLKSCEHNIFNKMLVNAVESGDREVFCKALNGGACVNTFNIRGNSSLVIACIKGFDDMALSLIDHGAYRGADADGWTPLMFASKFNRLAIAKSLIAKDSNINYFNNEQYTALLYACACGHLEVAKLLVSGGAQLGAIGSRGYDALRWAIRRKKRRVVSYLLSCGALVKNQHLKEAQDLRDIRVLVDLINAQVNVREDLNYLPEVSADLLDLTIAHYIVFDEVPQETAFLKSFSWILYQFAQEHKISILLKWLKCWGIRFLILTRSQERFLPDDICSYISLF